MVSLKEVSRYLQIVKELKSQYTFFDVHAHPYEIIFDSYDYHPSYTQEGVHSINHTPFRPPELSTLKLESTLESHTTLSPHWRSGISLINLRRIYHHTGPKVFSDHMELSGIDHVMLLPVALSTDEIDKHLYWMAEIFRGNPRFLLGCCVPDTVEDKEISKFVKEKVDQINIRAMKLHPNITETNLGSKSGKERVECILDVCRKFRLPIIIHGGRSTVLKNPKAAEYGWIENFAGIDWGISNEVVVIAHAGGYGCDLNEMKQDVLPTLKSLLSHYNNLMIDISGLEIDALAVVIKNIDLERILFGSDALYNTQWATLVKFAHAITSEGMNLAESIVQIASRNPLAYIFK